jgi:3'(2'), 5'-bisphosphate nucleotidase
MTLYSRELDIARQAARQAAALCMAVRAESSVGDGMEKAGREPVTIADYGSQAVILRLIAQEFPEDGVIAEERGEEFATLATETQRERVCRHISTVTNTSIESGIIQQLLDHGRGVSSRRAWAIDPIDGTKGFLRNDQFAVAIALLVDGEPVVGVLACPVLPIDPDRPSGKAGVIGSAVVGQGASLEDLNGNNLRLLRASGQKDPTSGRMVESVESGHSDHDFSSAIVKLAGITTQPVRMDSQAKYAAVADSRAEIYIRHSQGKDYVEKIWDHAAGVLMVKEAGGMVTDLDGKPLDFSRGGRLSENHGILATNGHLHGKLIEAIREAKQNASGAAH